MTTAIDTTYPRIKAHHWDRIQEFVAAAELGTEGAEADAIRLKRRGLPVRVLIVTKTRADAFDAARGAVENITHRDFSATHSGDRITFPRGSWIRIVVADAMRQYRGLRCDVVVTDNMYLQAEVPALLSEPNSLGIMLNVANGTEVNVGKVQG